MPQALTNLNYVKSVAFPTLTDQSSDQVIQTLINAASAAAEYWCHRTFSVSNYDEYYDSDGSGSIFLRNFPILDITSVFMTRATLLSVRNLDRTTNSRAYIRTVQVPVQEIPTATTGVTLSRIAGGVEIDDATFNWLDFPTVQPLCNAINALGFSWQAFVQGGYGNWATADITPLQGSQNCLDTDGNLYALTTPLNDYDVVPETGEIRFSGSLAVLFGTGWVPTGFAGVGMGDLWPGVSLPRGSRNIRILYRAGFNIIPTPIQQAVALWAAHLFNHPNYAGEITSESLGDYSVTRKAEIGPPRDVKALLMPWRDIRVGST